MPGDFIYIRKHRLAAIALGGNCGSAVGGPAETIAAALGDIADLIGPIVAVSRFFRTPAFPPGSGPDYVNAAMATTTSLEADAILDALHRIEARHGRVRKIRWGARTLDLDLLVIGETVLPDVATVRQWMDLPPALQAERAPEHLILPHPRLQERAFVLIPLAEILPGWRHPVTGRTVAEMVGALPETEKASVRPL
ncbi:MAG: 2-amino-4-hydroxy-6-hydroxymethyldihydropteridine diphosphokinase [Albidovulum sp.]